MHGPDPPRPASATYRAPSGPKASPRGLSSPRITTLVVAAATPLAPASAAANVTTNAVMNRLLIGSPLLEAAIRPIVFPWTLFDHRRICATEYAARASPLR